MYGQQCRNYRLAVGATLAQIEGNKAITLLQHFESGRSSNVKHFAKYHNHAIKHHTLKLFWDIVGEAFNNEG